MSLAKYLARAKAVGEDAVLGRKVKEGLPRLGGLLGFEGTKDKVAKLARKHPSLAAGIGSGVGFAGAMEGFSAAKKALKSTDKNHDEEED